MKIFMRFKYEHIPLFTRLLIKIHSLFHFLGLFRFKPLQILFLYFYFLYKRFLEDPHWFLTHKFPHLFNGPILDIGANIGYTSIVFSKIVPTDSFVYAFEPEPFNLNRLEQNLKLFNASKNVKMIPLALGESTGLAELWVNESHTGDHRIIHHTIADKIKGTSLQVKVQSVDSFVNETKLNSIAFIKIDTKGSELNILKGMKKTLEKNPLITLSIELDQALLDSGYSYLDLINEAKHQGFHKIYILGKTKNIYPFTLDQLNLSIKKQGYVHLLFRKVDIHKLNTENSFHNEVEQKGLPTRPQTHNQLKHSQHLHDVRSCVENDDDEGLSPTVIEQSLRRVSQENKNIFWLVIPTLSFLAIILTTLFWKAKPWVDEQWYLDQALILQKNGFNLSFLTNRSVPAGPLHSLIHVYLSPFTHLVVPGIRLVNPLLFLMLLYVLGLWYQMSGQSRQNVLMLLSAPVIYPIVGTAITEIPSMLLFYLHLLLLFKFTQQLKQPFHSKNKLLFLCMTSGLLLGLSITGRQQWTLALPAAIPLFYYFKAHWKWIFYYFLAALVIPSILFFIWGGFVAKSVNMGNIPNFRNIFLSFSYIALIYSIYDLKVILKSKKTYFILLGISICLSFIFLDGTHVPLKGVVINFLTVDQMKIYALAITGFIFSFGLSLIHYLYMRTNWNSWKNWSGESVYLILLTFFLILSPAAIGNIFSGRYVVLLLPILLLYILKTTHHFNKKWLSIRMMIGSLIGLISLWSYYFN